MGISAFDVLEKGNTSNVQTPTPTTQNKGSGGSAFDTLPEDNRPNTVAPQNEPSFFEKISNVINNLSPLALRLAAPGEVNTVDPNSIVTKLKAANDNGKLTQALGLAGKDVLKTFSTSKGISDLGSDIVDAGKNTIQQIWDNPSGTIKSIPSSLLDMINTPLKAISGLDLEQEGAPSENVQARAQDIKDSAAQIAAGLVTEGASSVLKAGTLAEKTLQPMEMAAKSAKDLSGVLGTSTSRIGNLAKTAVRGGLSASAGGAAYGLVSGANNPDQISKVIASSIMFAPLGAVTTAFFKANPDFANVKNNVDLANMVQNKRALDFNLNNTIKDISTKATALVTSDDLADAVIKNHIQDADITPKVVQGVTASKLSSLPNTLPYDVHTFGSEDKVDVLLMPKTLKFLDVTPFKLSGFMNGETVSYDGKDYKLESSTPDQATISSSEGKNTVPLDQIRRTNNDLLYDPQKLLDQQYDNLKSKLTGTNGDWYQANSNDLVAAFKDLSYGKQLYFSNRIASEIPEVQDIFDKGNLEDFYSSTKPSDRGIGSYDSFIRNAQTNGYKVEIGDAGLVTLKDMSDPMQRVVASGRSLDDAMDFLAKSGQATGEPLGVGLQDPIGNGVGFKSLGEPPNVNRPEPIPFLQSPLDWIKNKVNRIDQAWQSMNNTANLTAHWLTPADESFKSVDKQYGTRFHSQFYDPTQVGKTRSLAAADPIIKGDLIRIARMASGMSLKELENTQNYLETGSPKFVINDKYSRPLTEVEQNFAKQFNNNESIQKAFKYRAFLRDNPNVDQPTIDAFNKGIGMDDASTNMAKLMDTINGYAKDNADLGKIITLARAINDNAVDRPQYAKLSGMTNQHIAVANALEALTRKLAPIFGVDPKDVINNWMTHARLYSAGDLQGALNLFNRQSAPEANEAYFKMARTGEIDSYERNPLVAMYRYITNGFDSIHYNQAEANAKTYLEAVMNQSPEAGGLIPGPEKAKIRAMAEGYLNDLRGRTPLMSNATESMWAKFIDEYVPDMSPSVRDKVVGLNKMVQVGTQGYKVGAGVRDGIGVSGMILARFGPERLASILEKGANEVENGNQLIKQGHITGLTLDRLVNPTEDETNVPSQVLTGAKTAYQKFADLSLKGSGQEQIYNLFRQGAYLDTFSRVSQAARDFRGGKIDKAGFLDAINAKSDFSTAINAEIENQLNQSPTRLDELAKYLARESARQITPTYGLGNNPSGWNRNIGKILGQYGSYSTWLLHSIQEATTTGSIGDRLARSARFAGWTFSVAAMSRATGLNFSPWYIHRFGFSGGPLGQLGMNIENAVGSTGYEQKNAADQLSRLLPIGPNGFQKQFYIPASFAFSDYADALNGNPLSAIGIHPQGVTGEDLTTRLVNSVTQP